MGLCAVEIEMSRVSHVGPCAPRPFFFFRLIGRSNDPLLRLSHSLLLSAHIIILHARILLFPHPFLHLYPISRSLLLRLELLYSVVTALDPPNNLVQSSSIRASPPPYMYSLRTPRISSSTDFDKTQLLYLLLYGLAHVSHSSIRSSSPSS